MIVGETIICINDTMDHITLEEDSYDVTIGQIYEVSNTLIKDWILVKEKGYSYYPKELFITVKQHRKNQLKLIGI